MAERTAAALTLVALAMLAAPLNARAQPLARLTVQSFTLSADNLHPRVETPFRLIVTLRVRERVDRIANLELPMLAELELLGDERQTVAGPPGTQYRETITVVAHHAGAIAIAPATLQAIDARDGKPKQWYSNALNVEVGAAPMFRAETAAALARRVFWILLWLLGLTVLVLLLVVLLRRRGRVVVIAPPPRPMPPPPPTPPPPVMVVRSRRAQLEDALTVLRAERTRAAALAVRNAVWRMLGANEGATLGDVLGRRESGDPTMRGLLVALERAAFTYDDDLHGAIDDACAALQRSIESLP